MKMLRKFLGIFFSCLSVLFASLCVGLYLRSEFSDVFFIKPFFRVVIMILACVGVYFAARISGDILFPEKRKDLLCAALTVSFALYLVLLVNFLFFESSFSRGYGLIFLQDKETISYYLDNFLNVEPFSMIRRYFYGYSIGTVSLSSFLMNTWGNFVLFMPFAFFLPVFYKKQNNFFLFFFTVALTSAAAEVLQVLFMMGTGDIDDLIMNTVGACLLFGVLHTKIGKKVVDFMVK